MEGSPLWWKTPGSVSSFSKWLGLLSCSFLLCKYGENNTYFLKTDRIKCDDTCGVLIRVPTNGGRDLLPCLWRTRTKTIFSPNCQKWWSPSRLIFNAESPSPPRPLPGRGSASTWNSTNLSSRQAEHTQVHPCNYADTCHFTSTSCGVATVEKYFVFLRTCKIPLPCANFQNTGKVAMIHRVYSGI